MTRFCQPPWFQSFQRVRSTISYRTSLADSLSGIRFDSECGRGCGRGFEGGACCALCAGGAVNARYRAVGTGCRSGNCLISECTVLYDCSNAC